jgi:hypothetical protein
MGNQLCCSADRYSGHSPSKYAATTLSECGRQKEVTTKRSGRSKFVDQPAFGGDVGCGNNSAAHMNESRMTLPVDPIESWTLTHVNKKRY